MPRAVRGLLGLVLGYAAGAAAGALLVAMFSANTHDRSLETVMTAFFAAGPLGATVGLVLGLRKGKAAA